MVYRLIKFISDAHVKHVQGLETDSHIVRNDVGHIGIACRTCRDLPQPDFNTAHVRLIDTWGLWGFPGIRVGFYGNVARVSSELLNSHFRAVRSY